MITYTIEKGSSYITEEIVLKGSTTVTNEVAGCGDCNNNKTYKGTYSFYSFFTQSSNGNYTSSIIEKYKDNGPNRCPQYKCSNILIGGYRRCNSYDGKSFTIYSTNGKATISKDDIINAGGGADQYCSTNYNKSDFENGTYNIPITTTTSYFTTKSGTYNSPFRVKTTRTNYSFILSTSQVNGQVYFEYIQKTFTEYTHTEIKTIINAIKLTTKSEKNKTIGYKNANGNSFPALNPNYVQTVVYLDDNNIFWYRTNNEFPQKSKNFEEIYKSIATTGKEITISFITPTLLEGIIGTYNSNFIDENYSTKGKTELIIDTIKIISIAGKSKTAVTPNLISYFPFNTISASIYFLTTSEKTLTTKYYTKFTAVRTTTKSDYIIDTFNIGVDGLSWVGASYKLDKFEIYDSLNYKYSTHGEYTTLNTTVKDYASYKYILDYNYKIIGNPNSINSISNISPLYEGAIVSPNNLTSFAKNVFFSKSKTFPIDGYINPVSVLFNVVLPVNNNFSIKYTQATETYKFNFSKMSIANISREFLVQDSSTKYTSMEISDLSWYADGQQTSTFFPYQGENLWGKTSIGNPNDYYNVIDTEYYLVENLNRTSPFINYGKYRDDGNTQKLFSRLYYPGTYLQIKNNQIQSISFESPQLVNITEDNNRPFLIQCLDKLIVTQKEGAANIDTPYYTVSSIDCLKLAYALGQSFI